MTYCDAIADTYALRRRGSQWRGPCPVHGGSGEAFVLREREDGRPLIHCHAGCDFREMVGELRARGLWPEDDRPAGPPPKKVEWARWVVRLFDTSKANGERLSEQDWRDYRKARAVLREVERAA